MSAKILVVDTSVTIQKVIGIMLANEAYEITQCPAHENLKNLLKSSAYSLIVADYNFLPEKNGMELSLKCFC